MNGDELYAFLFANLMQGQVLYITNQNGLHGFNQFLGNGNLQFTIPNHNNPAHPNLKSIPKKIIIESRNLYLQGGFQFEARINELAQLWHHDCRVQILKQIIKLPDYLMGH